MWRSSGLLNAGPKLRSVGMLSPPCRNWRGSFSFRPHAPNISSMSDWGATRRITAEVVLADGVVLEGHMHLVASAAYPLNSESPLEMLNRADPFFALTLEAGEVA